jgi:uncharacterized membrane protein
VQETCTDVNLYKNRFDDCKHQVVSSENCLFSDDFLILILFRIFLAIIIRRRNIVYDCIIDIGYAIINLRYNPSHTEYGHKRIIEKRS